MGVVGEMGVGFGESLYKWEWAAGSRCIITKAHLHKETLSLGGATGSSQGPENWALTAPCHR